jgi:DNA-binding response OmpR family regulator
VIKPLSAFGDVCAVLCETNPSLRSGLQAALSAKGLRDVITCKDAKSLSDTLQEETVDLIVCDMDLPGLDFCEMAQCIRHKNCGRNPFVLIISTLSDASVTEVRRVINAGVDRVVRKPMSMNSIVGHVDALAQSRKPFVATEKYVGPTRRVATRPDESKNDLINVPNTLHSKVFEMADATRVQRMIDGGWVRVEDQKAYSLAAGIVRTINHVLAYYDKGEGTIDGLRRDLASLVVLSEELVFRHKGNADHIAEIASSLKGVAMRLAGESKERQKVHLQLLAKLGEVVRRSTKAKSQSIQVVRQIAKTVGQFSATGAASPNKLH